MQDGLSDVETLKNMAIINTDRSESETKHSVESTWRRPLALLVADHWQRRHSSSSSWGAEEGSAADLH